VHAFDDARVVTPAWLPDGQHVIAASDPDSGPFNLFEFSVDGSSPPRQLTHTTGGATWPDISPDGATIAFVGYTPGGFDLFTMPYEQDAAPLARRSLGDAAADSRPPLVESVPSKMSAYSPWPSLKPTSWSPVWLSDADQMRVGVATSGRDV